MSFAWTPALILLLVGPVLVIGYLALLKRRAARSAELAAKGFLPTASTLRLRKLRHIPFAFFLAGLMTLLFATARPQATVSIPRREGTVILAFDVSNSMRAKDIEPTRIDAAKAAANAFVKKQPSTIKVGVVAFGDGALITQQPTNDKTAVLAAINRLTPQGATSLGKGIFSALNAINGKPIVLPKTAETTTTDVAPDPDASTNAIDNVKIGYFSSAAIVLLSDGENTTEPAPLDMAKLSSVAGVKIYPVGIGKPEGTVLQINGFQISTALDEPLLQDIAKVTNGTYFHAEDKAGLANTYNKIDLKWHSVPKKTELTGIAAGVSSLFLVVGSLLSLLWFGRLV